MDKLIYAPQRVKNNFETIPDETIEILTIDKESRELADKYIIENPIIYQPDILFIGINPEQGAFIENCNNGIKEPPVIMLNPNKNIELDWFKDGNARANKKTGKPSNGMKEIKASTISLSQILLIYCIL